MIELITGLPGNGKTLFTLSKVNARAIAENRQVYYHGIPELTLPWQMLDDPKEWAKVPPNSIVVIDESQKTFRNRSLGSQPPPFVTDLETHRHLGIDLVLLTQHPSLIDPAVRRLAGRHQHLVRLWGMQASTVHEWASVKDNCDKSRADSQKTKWGFDKSMYTAYKSAEVHTMKRSIPLRVKMLLLMPVALIAAGYGVYAMVIKPKLHPAGAIESVEPGAVGRSGQPGQRGQLGPGAGQRKAPFDPVADAKEYVAMATPRVEGLPHTAPRYDAITVAVRAPVPAACIASKDKCKCWSQQGTPMDVTYSMCMGFAKNGWFMDFDPEQDRRQNERQADSRRVMDGHNRVDSVNANAGVPLNSQATFDNPARIVAGAQGGAGVPVTSTR